MKQKLDSAQWFIDAIKQRQETLQRTMETIILLQRDFFLTGEEEVALQEDDRFHRALQSFLTLLDGIDEPLGGIEFLFHKAVYQRQSVTIPSQPSLCNMIPSPKPSNSKVPKSAADFSCKASVSVSL